MGTRGGRRMGHALRHRQYRADARGEAEPMRVVATGLPGEHIAGRDQLEYSEVPATMFRHPEHGLGWMLRYRFNDEDRQRIANGEDMVVVMIGEQLHPSLLTFYRDFVPEGEETT